jgi:hypothetical protein
MIIEMANIVNFNDINKLFLINFARSGPSETSQVQDIEFTQPNLSFFLCVVKLNTKNLNNKGLNNIKSNNLELNIKK